MTAQEKLSSDETGPVRGAPARRWAVAAALALVCLAVGGALVLLLAKPPQKSLCSGPAPAMALQLYDGYRGGWPGSSISLDDLKGKGVVVNFWASWCQPCAQEAADMQAAWQKYKDQGVVFVGVDYLDQEPNALQYLHQYGVDYPNGPDMAGQMAQRYAIRGVPETFFIDPQGQLTGCRQVGPIDGPGLAARIAQILPGQPSSKLSP